MALYLKPPFKMALYLKPPLKMALYKRVFRWKIQGSNFPTKLLTNFSGEGEKIGDLILSWQRQWRWCFFQRRGDRIQHNFLHNGGVWRADWWYTSLCRYCYRWYEQVLNMTKRDDKLKWYNSGVMKILKFQSAWSYTASETAPYQVYLITNANNPEKNIKILHTWSLGALFLSLLASWLPPLHLRPCDQRRKPVTPPHRNT